MTKRKKERGIKKMSKSKVVALDRNGKDKMFMEVKIENGEIIGIGNPFKIYGACRLESPDKVKLVVEEVEVGE